MPIEDEKRTPAKGNFATASVQQKPSLVNPEEKL